MMWDPQGAGNRAARALRVACVLPGYFPHVAGSEVYAEGVCEALAARGHDVRVICPREPAELPAEELRAGVRVLRAIGERAGAGLRLRSALERVSRRPERSLAKPRALQYEAQLQRAQPDLILAMPVPRPCVVAAARHARRSGRPAVLVPFYHVAYERFLEDEPAWMRLMDGFTAVLATTAVEEEFLAERGVARARLQRPGMFARPLARPAADAIARLRSELDADGRFLVASAAAELSEPKGSLALVQAAQALPELRFALIGGTERSRRWLEGRIAIPGNVRLLGFVNEPTKALVLAAADLFALPSRADSFGIVYQEAHSLGTPSLGLDLPVIREVLGPAGFHVSGEQGAAGLARTLAWLATRPPELERAARSAPEVARRHDPALVLERIVRLLESLVC